MTRVSIHAPAWGATGKYAIISWAYNVSIHAPAWGATSIADHDWFRAKRFNPRARVGRDAPAAAPKTANRRVSIHAPAWGATVRAV